MFQIIKIKVIPRAGKNEIVGKLADGTFKIKLKAPPVDGKANEELVKFLSKEWGVAKSEVCIVSGQKTRTKLVQIAN
ncbi:MAG: YggU family protein [Candidatus Magasanikbacteria bacterium]|nr:YggU family protein [Candidatus Magasanikbacteria bacterium]